MVITIFGATGMVGSRLVSQALAQGFTVKAFARNVEQFIDMDIWEDKFEAIQGHVFDEADVFNAIKGSQAVLSALGGAMNGEDKTRSLGVKNIVKQMNEAGVDRIIAVGGMGVLCASDDSMIMDQPGFPHQYLAIAKEHLAAYQYLKKSGLDWTFVCPPNINNKDADGRYVTSANYPPAYDRNHISAGNLAAFIVSELNDNHYIQQRVGISDAN